MLNCRMRPCRAVAPATVTTFSIWMCCVVAVGGRVSKAALTSVLLVITRRPVCAVVPILNWLIP